MNALLILILSEILLSLYPIAVKHTNKDYQTLAFIRIIIFAFLSLFFIKSTAIFSIMSIIIGALNFIHIQFIYKGYKELKEPVSNTIFYTYPIFIAIFAAIFFGQKITIPQILLLITALVGVYLINHTTIPDKKQYIIYILLAAIVEALLLLLMKFGGLTTMEFISSMYIWSLVFSILMNRKSIDYKNLFDKDIIPYVLFICIIGFTGLYMRFYSITKLSTFTFSHFSYLAVIFSFIIGLLYTKEEITKYDISGSLLIIATIIVQKVLG